MLTRFIFTRIHFIFDIFKTFSFLVNRVALVLDTPAVKENVGVRGLPGPLVLQDLQLRWSDLGMGLLCSRWLDPLVHRDHQGRMEPPDLKELMGSR